jgi:hypothetical protein
MRKESVVMGKKNKVKIEVTDVRPMQSDTSVLNISPQVPFLEWEIEDDQSGTDPFS